jgi:predicted metal-dependent HD superfamily phosphohydrolase
MALWTRIGSAADAPAVFDQLASSYADPARAYHTASHINDCLSELDRHRDLASKTDEVEAAIWFHDAVYVPGAVDNEARSAEWATRALRAAGGSPGLVQRVRDLVLATRHAEIPAEPDARLLCDIDLSILGRSAPAFEAYERQIRREYAWVPEADYRRGRAQVLAGFLNRPSIYQTAAFVDRYESQARKNLARALAQLSR